MAKPKTQPYNLLIIDDDDACVLKTFSNYLQGTDITARCLNPTSKDFIAQTVDTACKYSIRAATIDYDLGDNFAGSRFTGNQVGKALLNAFPSIRLAGITGGSSKDFDSSLFVIREHKASMNQESYKALCSFLLTAKEPGREYSLWKESNAGITEIFAAMYVLAQGYAISKRVQAGKQPIKGMTLQVRSDEELHSLLSMIAEPEFAAARASFSDDRLLSALMSDIEKGKQIDPASVFKLEEHLKLMLEEKSGGS